MKFIVLKHWHRWSIMLLILFTLFMNCSQKFTAIQDTGSSVSSSVGSPSAPTPPNSSMLSYGQGLYQNLCASCHGPLAQSGVWGKNANDISNAIATQAAMAQFKSLSPSDISAIALALNTTIPPASLESVTDFGPVMGNSYYEAARLTALYVSDSNPDANDQNISSLISKFVSTRADAFGGTCNRNDTNCGPGPCGQLGGDCYGSLSVLQNLGMNGNPGAVRSGLQIQVCEQILAVDKAVQNITSKAGLNYNLAPDSTGLTKLASFHNMGLPLDPSLVPALIAIVSAATGNQFSSLDQWRFAELALCETTNADLF